MFVADSVHQIRSGYHGIYTSAYLIEGEGLTLIDAGETETWSEGILPYIRSIGRDPSELGRVVHSHGHDDHVHSDPEIRRQTGAQIWISELGTRFLEHPGSRAAWEEGLYDGFLTLEEREAIHQGTDYRGPPRREEVIAVDHCYREGETIEAGPLRLEVIAAPGHTRDSFCFYEPHQRLLFTGDAVNGEGTAFDDLPVFQDLEALPATMERLQRLDLDLLLAAHPYLPFRDSILPQDKARELMRRTAEFSRSLSRRLEELLAQSGGERSTAELSALICAEMGPNRPEPRAHGTVRLHLVGLKRAGKVDARVAEDGVWWSWRKERSG
jgi:glyoxylase-like metal-dependent hydrolase (beta-lactamase superfamily II)